MNYGLIKFPRAPVDIRLWHIGRSLYADDYIYMCVCVCVCVFIHIYDGRGSYTVFGISLHKVTVQTHVICLLNKQMLVCSSVRW
jgi:hypothetical protein